MKRKILFLLSIMLLSISFVSAKENRLYFTAKGNRIYYESKLFDEKIFMSHLDMIPGRSYMDELTIENGTHTNYTLYFKVVPREQSDACDELLENILMKITLDGNVIYDGVATGIDYTSQGINLQDAILLGDFSPTKVSKMVVETELSTDYSSTEGLSELSYIDWTFYAQYDEEDPSEIIPSPDTLKNRFPYTLLCSIVVIVIGMGIILYGKKEAK